MPKAIRTYFSKFDGTVSGFYAPLRLPFAPKTFKVINAKVRNESADSGLFLICKELLADPFDKHICMITDAPYTYNPVVRPTNVQPNTTMNFDVIDEDNDSIILAADSHVYLVIEFEA
jgi:hypothetical protein